MTIHDFGTVCCVVGGIFAGGVGLAIVALSFMSGWQGARGDRAIGIFLMLLSALCFWLGTI